ncbi:hypothetical protein PQR71_39870 [Paraburkholderia fungorum]|uniref:hypothetical protein n=1 Tax=Paraburkholderia fungorum TaxID=134537 RepID=UPI0038BAF265
MPEFDSFGDMARHLERVARTMPRETAKALETIGKHVEQVAKDKIGHIQDASGEFNAWEDLAYDTQVEHFRVIERGQAAPDADVNSALLLKGDLREGIKHSVEKGGREQTLTVGSESQVAYWQEAGTDKIPPRPAIGPAMFESEQMAIDLLGKTSQYVFSKV